MIEEGLLVPLDHQKLTGTEDLSPFLMDQAFDPDNTYSIPYFGARSESWQILKKLIFLRSMAGVTYGTLHLKMMY